MKRFLQFILFGALLPGGLIGADYSTGPQTEENTFNGDTINLFTGADVTFTGDLKNNVTVNVNGGYGLFSGAIQNNVFFDITGGKVDINSVQNNATFKVDGGDIQFNESVGNNAEVDVSGGTVLLGNDDVFSNNTNFTMSGGTLDTQGHSVNFDSLTLTGNATLDLADNPDIFVDVGKISGTGTLTVENFVTTNQLIFDSGTSDINVGKQVYYGSTPAVIDPDNPDAIIYDPNPVPEPATWFAGSLLLLAALGFEIYRRR